jgi:hypothetical protein
MDPNATRAQKMEALGRARTHNLDVTVIARETVRLILEEAFAVSFRIIFHSCLDSAERFIDYSITVRGTA